jgi:hypothetical protein
LVRPDTHIAWARKEGEGMEEAAAKALGWFIKKSEKAE